MRPILILLLLSAVVWAGIPLLPAGDGDGGAALAKSGSSGSGSDGDGDDDKDDDDGKDGDDGKDDEGGEDDDDHPDGPGMPGAGGDTGGDIGGEHGEPLLGRESLAIRYIDGRVERVRDGVYEALDPRGRVVMSHAARQVEVERLRSLADAAGRRGGAGAVEAVVEIGERGTAIEVTDYRGWREIVARGAYVVKDPKGRTVVRRPVTAGDIARIRSILGLD